MKCSPHYMRRAFISCSARGIPKSGSVFNGSAAGLEFAANALSPSIARSGRGHVWSAHDPRSALVISERFNVGTSAQITMTQRSAQSGRSLNLTTRSRHLLNPMLSFDFMAARRAVNMPITIEISVNTRAVASICSHIHRRERHGFIESFKRH
jgi:hypothetical protein